jgi:ribosomal-protein-alanine N-acetyltransferase
MALLRAATPSDLGPVIESEYVTLRTPQMSDYPAWAELRAASREFLTPWEPLWASDADALSAAIDPFERDVDLDC